MATALRIREVEKRVGLKKSAIYKLIREGDFPKPLQMGRASAWLDQDLDAWLASRPRGVISERAPT